MRNYINHSNNFLQIFASTGKKYTISVSLFEFHVYGKQHRLDLNETLAVEHEMVQEIFDKLIQFTEEINDDKDHLKLVYDMYRSTVQKAKVLEIYIRDLFKGTRKFEEQMLDNFKKYELINPQNLPKLMKIKNLVLQLETKQRNIYHRFESIKAVLSARRVFQNMKTSLLKMEGVVLQLNDQIGSDAYQTFFGKTIKVVDFLKKFDFREMIIEAF